MSVIIFECKKCGTCCRSLLEDLGDGVINGLFLTPKESRLFPSELRSPKIAIGKRKPIEIVAYQFNLNVCSHVTERNECGIYHKRPLACRSFPFDFTSKANVSVKCPIIGNQMKEGEIREIEFSATEKEAGERLNRYLRNLSQKYSKRHLKMWKFDLLTRKWIGVE